MDESRRVVVRVELRGQAECEQDGAVVEDSGGCVPIPCPGSRAHSGRAESWWPKRRAVLRAVTTVSRPSGGGYCTALTSAPSHGRSRYCSPSCTRCRTSLYAATCSAARSMSAALHRFRSPPIPSTPVGAVGVPGAHDPGRDAPGAAGPDLRGRVGDLAPAAQQAPGRQGRRRQDGGREDLAAGHVEHAEYGEGQGQQRRAVSSRSSPAQRSPRSRRRKRIPIIVGSPAGIRQRRGRDGQVDSRTTSRHGTVCTPGTASESMASSSFRAAIRPISVRSMSIVVSGGRQARAMVSQLS